LAIVSRDGQTAGRLASAKVYLAAEIKSLSVKDLIPHYSPFVDFGAAMLS
jgi:hypothetical protein